MKGGKDSHDHRYKHFYDIFDKESEFYLKDARIRERPYKRNEQTIETQTLLQNDIREFEDTYYNVFDLFGHGVTWTNNDYSTKADLFSRRRMQRLCQGTVSFITNFNGHFPGCGMDCPKFSHFLITKNVEKSVF